MKVSSILKSINSSQASRSKNVLKKNSLFTPLTRSPLSTTLFTNQTSISPYTFSSSPFSTLTTLKQLPKQRNNNNEEEEEEEEMLKKNEYYGLLLLCAALGLVAISVSSAEEKKNKKNKKKATENDVTAALSPSEWRSLTLSEIQVINHNTNLFRFKFDNERQIAGLTVASCLIVRVWNDETQEFDVRPYTPTTSPDTHGYLDLIVKKYETGKVTPKIFNLKVGDKLEFQGPFTKIEYKPNFKKEIGMIAGGTGITPMLQVLREILKNKEDKTKVSLIFANISEQDILLKEELDLLAEKHKNFQVYYTLDNPSSNWKQGKGFVSENMIKEHLPSPNNQSNDRMIFVCGPDPMLKFLAGPKGPNYTQGDLTGLLSNLGYSQDQVFKF